MTDILKRNPEASFGFIGSNTYNPITKEEEPIDHTKRFKVYKHAMEAKMGPVTFSHAWLPKLSQ
jgi:hypothetical protein